MSSSSLPDIVAALTRLADNPAELAELSSLERQALRVACGRLAEASRDDKLRLVRALRKKERRARRAGDVARVADTGLRALRRRAEELLARGDSTAPPTHLVLGERIVEAPATAPRAVNEPRTCYVCKQPYLTLHFFYDALCPACGDFNYRKRSQSGALAGRVALITGARVKIGYQATLMLLRAGARVVATSRFPKDAARRFAAEPDFSTWCWRLELYGLDLRHVPSVERFASTVAASLDRLDFLINNAAQTVRRPPGFFAHLLPGEQAPLDDSARRLLPAASEDATSFTQLSLRDDSDPLALWFPPGERDVDWQQVDRREHNSWRMHLDDVPVPELLEVHLVNAVAPFVLATRLKPLMQRQRTNDKHVVNVSAMEGVFARGPKTARHPHTNMAKAALNMMTRTSAQDYARSGIFMNSVDTGWVTDEDPLVHVGKKRENLDFQPPLDPIDGAARVLDPIFSGLATGNHAFGQFFKDYRPSRW